MERLEHLLIKYISNVRKLKDDETVKLIDDCIHKVAKNKNMNYNDVYKIFHEYRSLTQFMKASCSKTDLDECNKLCHCVNFKNTCYPRFLREAYDINLDPDKYAKSLSLKDLSDLVELASFLYYNYEGGGLSDNSFDALEYDLNKRMRLKGRRHEKIGAEPIDRIRTKLPYPMMSLDKLKPDSNELIRFLSKVHKGLVCSDKLDGVSCMIVFNKGTIKMYTRGNGEIGGDISSLQKYIKLPKITDDLVVRGELILPRDIWQEKYKGTYANSRAFVSGKVNQGFISDTLSDIHFVAYQIISPTRSPSETFTLLEEMGFETAYHTILTPPVLIFDLVILYKERRAESKYDVDGIVMSLDIPEGEDTRNPINTKAFKMLLEEQIRHTEIVDIKWNISRFGKYIPVAVFKPIYVEGARITRATAHNAQHVLDWSMGIDTKVTVVRSGDVIPQIKDVQVDKSIQVIYPNMEYSWHWEGSNIILDNVEVNPIVKMKRILYFIQTLGITGLGDVRIRNLIDHGIDDVKLLTNLTKQGMDKLKIPRFTGKTTEKIYASIHDTMRVTRLDRFLVAMTTFRAGIGPVIVKQLNRHYPNVFQDNSSTIAKNLNTIKIPGVGPKRKPEIAKMVPQFMEELYSLNKEDIKHAVEYQKKRLENIKKRGYNPLIQGGNFVLTGFMDHPPKELIDYIWDNWGDIAGNVDSKTRAVIVSHFSNVSSKVTKAHELGIKVYSLAEFVHIFKIPKSEVNVETPLIPLEE